MGDASCLPSDPTAQLLLHRSAFASEQPIANSFVLNNKLCTHRTIKRGKTSPASRCYINAASTESLAKTEIIDRSRGSPPLLTDMQRPGASDASKNASAVETKPPQQVRMMLPQPHHEHTQKSAHLRGGYEGTCLENWTCFCCICWHYACDRNFV